MSSQAYIVSSSSSSALSSEKPLPSIDSKDVCCICKDEFLTDISDKTHLVFHINCRNYFHKDCIGQALKIDERCPICRKKVDDENTHEVELGSDRQIKLVESEKLPKVDKQAQVAYWQWVYAPFEWRTSIVEHTLVQVPTLAKSDEGIRASYMRNYRSCILPVVSQWV